MMHSIIVKRRCETSHFLRGYDGKCSEIHGHSMLVEVKISAELLDATGFVVDFIRVKDIIDEFDHAMINKDVPYFKTINPTAENIGKYLCERIQDSIGNEVNEPVVEYVKIWETENNCAVYIPEVEED